ncbi:hypothetical protein [Rhodospirillum centenum]|uniref:Uncharacterized protein n=1 Tax=Rhodospirillum centenum (strain ATCC 51521 / SW) TaxID=414684 RepID=B6IS36_RHOCS|nr:hypothetical protein [Rhodospirillum centenum]ACI98272.1 hypothetical protein RC1_0842 [Rhodospirillum centenum SW]
MRRRRAQVAEGQRYRRIGVGLGIWEVIALQTDGVGKMHARLRREDDPSSVKTLAVSVLLDPRQFEPLPE